jgi:hypothetical protein
MTIHRMDEAGDPSGDSTDVEVYTVPSAEDFRDNEGFPRLSDDKAASSHAYAKKVTFDTGNIRFYAKTGKHGKFFNPVGLYSEGNMSRRMKGISEWIFRPVSEKAFHHYINFLKTNNTAWLSNAEREV